LENDISFLKHWDLCSDHVERGTRGEKIKGMNDEFEEKA
jgi:hypothetical protein